MIVVIIIVLLAVLFASIIKKKTIVDWESNYREILERENTEYDMGHDVSYKDSEDL